ncbi:MAG: alpha/beta fold hydrolase, partial [Myxococcota bacterium]|nr:alpha/beta fold hydrolase [Myxococcota bacterium]
VPWGQRGGRAWFDLDSPQGAEQLTARVGELNQLLDHLAARYPQAPTPILLGFSQGAMLSLQMLARHPDRVGGIVALSGFLPLDDENTPSSRPVPALLTMGDKDHLVTPDRTRAAATSLRALGHQPREVSFPGGHAIPREVMSQIRTFIREVAQLKAP